MKKEDRKASILESAIAVAASAGFAQMRMSDVAKHAQCVNGTVTLYWRTMTQLRRAVMRAAINRGIAKIVAAGLAIGDKDAKKAPEALKEAARASLG
jgi:AcrR family transcriptional regulator